MFQVFENTGSDISSNRHKSEASNFGSVRKSADTDRPDRVVKREAAGLSFALPTAGPCHPAANRVNRNIRKTYRTKLES